MTRANLAEALDAALIAENAVADAERTWLRFTGPEGCSMQDLIRIGRQVLDHQLDALETVTGVCSPDTRAFWRAAIIPAIVGRLGDEWFGTVSSAAVH